MMWYNIWAAAAVILVVTGPYGIAEAYSPFGGAGYQRPVFGGDVWVPADRNRAGSAEQVTSDRMARGSFNPDLTYGDQANNAENIERRAAYHSGLPFGKRTAMDRRTYHSAFPFGKRAGGTDADFTERQAFDSAVALSKRLHSGLPFGKRGGYHSGLPFGKRTADSNDDADEGAVERRAVHSGLMFGKRNAPGDEDLDNAVSDILSKLRSEDN